MKLKTEYILRLSAALLILAGVFWTTFNILRADDFKRKMQVKLDTISKLQEMKRQNDRIEAALVSLAAISNNAPSLSVLAETTAAGQTPDIRELESRALKYGLKAKKTEIVFNETRLDSIADFLRSAETQRPPWRLVDCFITSSQKTDGYGTAVLTMETVARETSSAKRLSE